MFRTLRFLPALMLVASMATSPAQGDCPPNFVLKWGSFGSGNGQINEPLGVATDGAGDVYVADYRNHRIQKFTNTGTYLTQWGSFGNGDGQFNFPTDVTTDAAGNVYVADDMNHRIQKFTNTGTYLTQWGSIGSGNGQFNEAVSVATDGAGNVYVADIYNSRIQKFTNTGTYITQWGSFGSGNGQFNEPLGVATDGAGDVYVADYRNHRIQKFTNTGTYLTQWGSFGSGDGQFNFPPDVTTDAAGSVYVADRLNNRIQKFAVLPSPSIRLVSDVRNDQGRQVRVQFQSSYHDCQFSPTPILQYEAFRRIDALVATGADVESPSLQGLAAARNAGMLSSESILLAGWEFVAAVPAHGESEYALIAQTLADSTAVDGITWSVFFVRAATGNPSTFFDSAPDSGYSVDNLPPVPPAPFTGAYIAGATNLHWGANTESDLWYYALYRGGTADFVPGPGNLIATRSDTGYVDVGSAGSYYKLTAVDVNGNVSGYSLLTPGQTVDVGGGAPLDFALEGVRPNPAGGEKLTVRFALPIAAPARLELVDVSGRRVVAREVGSLGAGRHAVDLAAGRRLPSGLYLVRLSQGGDLRVARVVVLD